MPIAIAVLGFVWWWMLTQAFASDAYIYWWAAHLPPDLYAGRWNVDPLSFVYSPAIAQLPFWLFYVLWTGALLALLAWLATPELAPLLLIPWDPVRHDILTGGIELPLLVALLLGLRYPAAWSALLLTKVTPGIGLLWFAVRREWRQLTIALAVTAAIAIVSVALAPGLWPQWFARLSADGGQAPPNSLIPIPLWSRLLLAALLIAWGARADRRWTLLVAVYLSLPNTGVSIDWTFLVVGLIAVWRFSPAGADARVPVRVGRVGAGQPGIA